MLVDQPFKQHFVFCGPQLPCPSARDIYEAQGSTCILKSIKTRMYVGRQPEQHGPSLRAFGYTRKNLPLHSQPKVQSRWSNSRPPIRENDYAVALSTIPLSRLFNTQQIQSANKPWSFARSKLYPLVTSCSRRQYGEIRVTRWAFSPRKQMGCE